MKKIVFVIGLAVGYVLGSRKGREGYDNLKGRAAKLWRDPRVQGKVADAKDVVKDKVPAASEAVDDVVEKVDDQAAASTTPAEELPGNV